MKYDFVLWDFNGTLLDDVDTCVKCLNELLVNHGLEQKTKFEYKNIFTFPIKDYYIAAGFDFNITDYDTLAKEWTKYYRAETDIKLYNGTRHTLETIKRMNISQCIISASEKSLLQKQVKQLKIDSFFSEIYGLNNIHASSKKFLAQIWRNENPDSKAVFVGDTLHDKDVADAIGADCILIPNGHQSKQTLSETGSIICEDISFLPDYI